MAIIVSVALFALTYFQVRPDRSAKASGLMMRASGAIAEVSVESARERILKVVSGVSGVVHVDAQVKPIRGRADVELQVTITGADTSLPIKQKEINRALSQVIDKQLGLRMAGHPRVKIQFERDETRKPVVATAETTSSSRESALPLIANAPLAAAVENQPEEKESRLDWSGKSIESDEDNPDDTTIHIASSTENDESVGEIAEKKIDKPQGLTPQIEEVEPGSDDTKTPGVEA
jgi:hypothetical protein